MRFLNILSKYAKKCKIKTALTAAFLRDSFTNSISIFWRGGIKKCIFIEIRTLLMITEIQRIRSNQLMTKNR